VDDASLRPQLIEQLKKALKPDVFNTIKDAFESAIFNCSDKKIPLYIFLAGGASQLAEFDHIVHDAVDEVLNDLGLEIGPIEVQRLREPKLCVSKGAFFYGRYRTLLQQIFEGRNIIPFDILLELYPFSGPIDPSKIVRITTADGTKREYYRVARRNTRYSPDELIPVKISDLGFSNMTKVELSLYYKYGDKLQLHKTLTINLHDRKELVIKLKQNKQIEVEI
jgi:hypothetical protein